MSYIDDMRAEAAGLRKKADETEDEAIRAELLRRAAWCEDEAEKAELLWI